ncbi:MAG: hypothetical protein ACI8QC_000131 [Planctomycetota bacterium]|jgi:hypothetical protein
MKKLLIIPGVLLAAFVVAMLTMSGEWAVSRTQVVHASATEINEVVERLNSWPEWSYWSKEQDPEASFTFSGPEGGVGSTWNWESDGELGTGTIKVVSSSVADGLRYELDMAGMTLQGSLSYQAVDGGTEVTFASEGKSEGWMKIFSPFVDSMVGPSYESSLAGLERHMLAVGKDVDESVPAEVPAEAPTEGNPVEATSDK